MGDVRGVMTISLEDLIDACPDCDTRNPTFPDEVAETAKGVRCVYRCTEGHAWTCSWAEPARTRGAS